MKKKIILLTLLLIASSLWGYFVGMIDYRLMIHTAATCSCWIKLAALMAFTTIVVSTAISYLIYKKTSLFLVAGKNIDE